MESCECLASELKSQSWAQSAYALGMCACYNLRMTPQKLAEIFQTVRQLDFRERFNVSPTQQVVAIRQEKRERVPVSMRWGLVPNWATGPKKVGGTWNAR